MAAWTQSDGAMTNIWAAKFDQISNAWGKAELVETISTGSAIGPEISVDAAGNAVVIWTQSNGSGSNIFANHYRINNGTWATPEIISTPAFSASAPTVKVDSAGNGIAVWRQFDDVQNRNRWDMWANRYTSSTASWSTPTLIESDDTGDVDNPAVAIDSSGNAVAVWSQKIFAWNSILSNRFDTSTGKWGTATLVENNNTNNAKYPDVAMDATGNAMAVWEHWEDRPDKGFNGPSRIASNRFNVGAGTWGTPVFVDADPRVGKFPDVSMDGAGNALAAWTQGDDIMASRFDAGTGSWDTPVLIEASNVGPGEVDRVRIAVDTVGNAIAAWDQFDGTQFSIFANRFSVATGTWGTAELIETDNAGRARSVSIAKNPLNGNTLAVWTQRDGNGLRSILGNHFK